MIAKIIDWSIKNRFLMIIMMLLLASSGIYTLLKTPVDAIPDLSDVQVIIKNVGENTAGNAAIKVQVAQFLITA